MEITQCPVPVINVTITACYVMSHLFVVIVEWMAGALIWFLSTRTEEGNICKQQGSCIPTHTYFKQPG